MTAVKVVDLGRHIHNPQLQFGFVCRELAGPEYTLEGLVCGGVLHKISSHIEIMASYGYPLHIEDFETYQCCDCKKLYIQGYDRNGCMSSPRGNLMSISPESHKVVKAISERVDIRLYAMSVDDLKELKAVSVNYNFPGTLLMHYSHGTVESHEL